MPKRISREEVERLEFITKKMAPTINREEFEQLMKVYLCILDRQEREGEQDGENQQEMD